MGRNGAKIALVRPTPVLPPAGRGVDLFWEPRWKTLGHGTHYEYHRAIGNVGVFRAPDPRTSSAIATGSPGNGDYPPPAWVDAIDKAAGRADWQLGEFSRLTPALEWLRVFDPIARDVVVELCVRGRSSVTFGRGVRHHSLNEIAQAAPFNYDTRKCQDWLVRSWELLALLIAPPETLEKALRAGAVARWAMAWARERGLVQPVR